jgi:hypothetical protein
VPLLLFGLGCSSPSIAQSPPEGLLYVPWTKFCLKGQELDAKPVCFEAQAPVVDAAPVDPEAFAKQQAALAAELRRRAEGSRKQ